MKLLILICIIASVGFAQNKRRQVPSLPPKPVLDVPYSENKLIRVDPHGSKKIKPTKEQAQVANECLVCHIFQESDLKTKPTAQDSCFNCHNHSPHSGVQEHLKHKVTCTGCHTFHRGDSVEWTPKSGIFKNQKAHPIEEGLVERNSHSAMLKKTCVECHK